MKLTDVQTQALNIEMTFIENDLKAEAFRRKKPKSSGILNTLKSWLGYAPLPRDDSDSNARTLETTYADVKAELISFEGASGWSTFWHWREIQRCQRFMARYDTWMDLRAISPLHNEAIQSLQKEKAVKALKNLSTQWHYFSNRRKACLSLASILDGDITMEAAAAQAMATNKESLTLGSEKALNAWLLEQESAFLAYGQRTIGFFSTLTHDAQFADLALNDERSCATLRGKTFERAFAQGYSYMGRLQRTDADSKARDKYLYARSFVFALRECRVSIAQKDMGRKRASFDHLARLVNESLALKPNKSRSELWDKIVSLKQGIQHSLTRFTWITCQGLFSNNKSSAIEPQIEAQMTQEENYARKQKTLMDNGTSNITVFSKFTPEHFTLLQNALSSIQEEDTLWPLKQQLNPLLLDVENDTRANNFAVNAKELAALTCFLQRHAPMLIDPLHYDSQALPSWKVIAESRQNVYRALSLSGTTLLPNTTNAGNPTAQYNNAFSTLKPLIASQPTSDIPSDQWVLEYEKTHQTHKSWLSSIPNDLIRQRHQICFSRENAKQLEKMTEDMKAATLKVDALLRNWAFKSAPERVLRATEIEKQLAYIATLKEEYIRFFNTQQECFLLNEGDNLSYFRALGFTYQKLSFNTESQSEKRKQHLERSASMISYHSCGLPSLTMATIKSYHKKVALRYHPDKNVGKVLPAPHCFRVSHPGKLEAFREAILTSPDLPAVAFLDINGQCYYAVKALGLLTPITLSPSKHTRQQPSDTLTFTPSELTDEMSAYHQSEYWNSCIKHINEAYAQIKIQTEELTLSASEDGITANFAYQHDAFLSAQIHLAREQFQARLSEFEQNLADERAEREREKLEAEARIASLEAMMLAFMQQKGVTQKPEAASPATNEPVAMTPMTASASERIPLGGHRDGVFSRPGSRSSSPQRRHSDELAQKPSSDELAASATVGKST